MSQHLWSRGSFPSAWPSLVHHSLREENREGKDARNCPSDADRTLFIFTGKGGCFVSFLHVFVVVLFFVLFYLDLIDFCLFLFETRSHYVNLTFLELAT